MILSSNFLSPNSDRFEKQLLKKKLLLLDKHSFLINVSRQRHPQAGTRSFKIFQSLLLTPIKVKVRINITSLNSVALTIMSSIRSLDFFLNLEFIDVHSFILDHPVRIKHSRLF